MNNHTSTTDIHGRAWVFGDNIDTDSLAPGAYFRAPLPVLAQHCLESVSENFATEVEQGDFIVGGDNFGLGSSRELAVQALMFLGIKAIVAKSFARIFYRNAINLGLPVLVCEDIDDFGNGDRISVDIGTGIVSNHSTGKSIQCEPIAPFLVALIEEGGLLPSLKNRLATAK